MCIFILKTRRQVCSRCSIDTPNAATATIKKRTMSESNFFFSILSTRTKQERMMLIWDAENEEERRKKEKKRRRRKEKEREEKEQHARVKAILPSILTRELDLEMMAMGLLGKTQNMCCYVHASTFCYYIHRFFSKKKRRKLMTIITTRLVSCSKGRKKKMREEKKLTSLFFSIIIVINDTYHHHQQQFHFIRKNERTRNSVGTITSFSFFSLSLTHSLCLSNHLSVFIDEWAEQSVWLSIIITHLREWVMMHNWRCAWVLLKRKYSHVRLVFIQNATRIEIYIYQNIHIQSKKYE